MVRDGKPGGDIDADLYARGTATLLAAWEQYARGARDAAVHRLPGVAAAVVPHGPDHAAFQVVVARLEYVPAA